MVIKSKGLSCRMTCFLCHFEQNRASISLLKIAGQNRIFSPLIIEAKLIENLLPLGLEDDKLHFNKRPEYAHPVLGKHVTSGGKGQSVKFYNYVCLFISLCTVNVKILDRYKSWVTCLNQTWSITGSLQVRFRVRVRFGSGGSKPTGDPKPISIYHYSNIITTYIKILCQI